MRKLLIVFAVATMSAGLAGCATSGSGGGGALSTTNVAQTITQVQAAARQICAFVPTARTVANVLSVLGIPGLSTAADVAAQICTAVTTQPLADGPGGRGRPKVCGARGCAEIRGRAG